MTTEQNGHQSQGRPAGSGQAARKRIAGMARSFQIAKATVPNARLRGPKKQGRSRLRLVGDEPPPKPLSYAAAC